MNNNINFTEEELQLADQYMNGHMTADEREAFEKLLATDHSWKEKYTAIRLLSTGIKEASLRNEMQQWNGHTGAAPVRSIAWVKKLAIAASLLLAVFVLSWALFFKKSANENLYAHFYKPDPGLATRMSVADNYEFERAMLDYKTGDYNAALERWNKLLAENNNNDSLQYFIASANLADKKSALAVTYFDQVIQQTNSVFKSEAYWYKGLALLQQGKKKEAIVVIQRSTHPQKNALLQKLKN